MFGFLEEMAKGIGSVVGAIAGVPIAIVAEMLGISISMVEQAKRAGCETYEEIRNFHKL